MKKILLYQGGRYFGGEKTYNYFKDILNDYNIDCFDTREDFAIIADYIPRNGYNSSIMNFGVGTMNHIYNKFKPEYSSKYWGDQAWITLQTRTFASIYSREWVRSYKWECLNPSFHIPENCKIILYHGKPDPHETLEDVGEYWC